MFSIVYSVCRFKNVLRTLHTSDTNMHTKKQKHTIYIYIYIYIYIVKWVKLTTVDEGNPKASFSIATTCYVPDNAEC